MEQFLRDLVSIVAEYKRSHPGELEARTAQRKEGKKHEGVSGGTEARRKQET